ncbi:unnamed protein product [Caretta caretta]
MSVKLPGKARVTMNRTEGLGSGPQLSENTTWSPLAPEPSPWESHTIVAVTIFCCVCLLHLSAFLYTICFQIQGHSRPAPRLASPGVYEENEIATFQPSPSATDTPARANPSREQQEGEAKTPPTPALRLM